MRVPAIASLLLCVLPAGSMADKPKVTHAMIQQAEDSLDRKLAGLWPQDPMEVLGLTRALYLTGYGIVFSGEINLAPGAGITPFHPSVKPEEVKRTHDKKLLRMPDIKKALQDMLVDSAASLDSVPGDEQIALGVSFFYWNWEDRTGLPSQIVLHAPKRILIQAKTGGKAAVTLDEIF